MSYLSHQRAVVAPAAVSTPSAQLKTILIPSRWGGKCSECECMIEVGVTVQYIPPSKSPAGIEIKGRVVHQDGECGSVYIVHVVYASTSKSLKVSEYSAWGALASVKSKITHLWGEIRGYEVWQGDIRLIAFQPALPSRGELVRLRRTGL